MADKRFHAGIDKVLKSHRKVRMSDSSVAKLARSRANGDFSALDDEQLEHLASIRQDCADELARRRAGRA